MKKDKTTRKTILNIGLITLLLLSPIFSYATMSGIKVTTSCGKVVTLLVGSEDQTTPETLEDIETLDDYYCGN